jgi:predicted TIM-barrel fold metal-dependent hydrolase
LRRPDLPAAGNEPEAAMLTRRQWIGVVAAGATVTGRSAEPQPANESEPDRPAIIDSHTHFYDPSRPEGVPWPSPDNATLHRTVLPPEWEGLAGPLGVTGTIVVEASPWVEDNQWLLDLADRMASRRMFGIPAIVGIVGNLPLGTAGCGALIDRFAAHRLFRGVRVSGARLREGLADPAFAADVGRLADKGLAVDVNGGDALAAAAAAATRWPRLRIIVDHMGNPRITAAGPPDSWREAVARAAAHDRVFLKASGMPESVVRGGAGAPVPLEPALYEPWLEAAWQAFGMRRLLFGSNWPVSTLAASYEQVLAIVSGFARGKGPEAERWLVAKAAEDAYRRSDA